MNGTYYLVLIDPEIPINALKRVVMRVFELRNFRSTGNIRPDVLE